MKKPNYVFLISGSAKTLARYYKNPDTGKWGFGFNIADGGAFLPETDLNRETLVVPAIITDSRKVIPRIIIDKKRNLVTFLFKNWDERADFIEKYLNHDAFVLARFSKDGKNLTFVIDEIFDYILIGPGLGIMNMEKLEKE